MTLKQPSLFSDDIAVQTHVAKPVAYVAPRSRTTDPATSKAAAAKVNIPGSWRSVAKVLDQLNAASSYEIETYARINNIAVSPSRIRGALAESEMLGAGLVRIVTVEAASQFGNDANIYSLTEAGKNVARET